MADIQEKEELTDQEVETSEVDSTENVEDYFNPFAESSEQDKQIEKDIQKENEDEAEQEQEVKVDDNIKGELAQIKAQNEATREVSKFIKEHPEFDDMSEDLVDLASKAMVKGHSKPVEFAIRNVRPPSHWIDYGKKLGREDLAEVVQNRVGGSSMPKTEGKAPDFMNMTSEEFNEYTRSIMSGA